MTSKTVLTGQVEKNMTIASVMSLTMFLLAALGTFHCANVKHYT